VRDTRKDEGLKEESFFGVRLERKPENI